MNRYFVIEGPDGSGKTTQLELLTKNLKSDLDDHYEVVQTREPGGPEISERIREILKDPSYIDTMLPLTGLLLFNAARAQLVHEQIKPAFEIPGRVILTDRSFFSTIAYQAFGLGLDKHLTKQLCEIAMQGVMPKQVFVLKVSFKEAKRRMKLEQSRPPDAFDGRNAAFHHKVRNGYDWVVKQYPEIVTELDGERDPEVIASELMDKVFQWWN